MNTEFSKQTSIISTIPLWTAGPGIVAAHSCPPSRTAPPAWPPARLFEPRTVPRTPGPSTRTPRGVTGPPVAAGSAGPVTHNTHDFILRITAS